LEEKTKGILLIIVALILVFLSFVCVFTPIFRMFTEYLGLK